MRSQPFGDGWIETVMRKRNWDNCKDFEKYLMKKKGELVLKDA